MIKYLNQIRGQTPIAILIPIAIAVVLSLVGSISYATYQNDTTNERVSLNSERIAAMTEAINTIKDDNKIIKTDLKEVLRQLK